MNTPILFCIPYAGGSSMSFSNITSLISMEGLEIKCLELPGRGLRHKEPLLSSLDEAVEDLYAHIKNSLVFPQRPILIWGHSMGAILALLVSSKLNKYQFNTVGLLVSGMKAPTHQSSPHTLSEKAKNKLLSDLLPIKYEQNKEAPLFQKIYKKRMEIMEKDVEILEKYQTDNWPKISVSNTIAVIMGESDELYPTLSYYENWKLHTSGNTEWFPIKGNHFFPMQHPEETARLLTQILTQILN
ncbi:MULTISPECIES: thioesterase II family protein [Chryseobacterium]|uniref:thioesterase II family protein n=1 Tax=Chryseobacterium TaxID=59732 RepID=UPI0009D80068|nr:MULTISPECIES: alpha/beta fold hydrolase [Chryseobacterium]MDC8099846.1 alpha/beta fold hydrolase [Chryseobacterium rhizosphaerae]SMC31482.1 Surfactin synthase thioesterase subunit [Chryseobacterium sp. YR221]